MLPSPEKRDPLEPVIHRTLRAQPLRRAPQTLESRVLAELARRAALPWWHKSYAHWPSAVRGWFFVLSALLVAVFVAGAFLLTRETDPAALADGIVGRFTWLALAQEVVTTVLDTALVLWRAIPSVWLYSLAAMIGIGSATLVGIGGATYRAFFAPRRVARSF